ncbi:DUF3592 domain-containing protein [Thiobacillus sp.]|uniref:DUF3592 domain-containing protein n=1 Tax=Thiobacillus sp. TaxID=924 RepID=UPI00286DF449|nr:DUF3592 domain-containing protein [Thiobacillus sp.]
MYALKIVWKIGLILLFTVITLVSILMAYSSYKKVNDVKTWRPLNATVASSIVEQERRSRGTTYCPIVMVDYIFNGQPFNSKLEIEDGPCSPVQASVSAVVEKFKQGSTVSAVVDPNKPSVIRIAAFSLGTNFYLMLVMAIVGIFAVGYFWRTPAEKLIGKGAKKN